VTSCARLLMRSILSVWQGSYTQGVQSRECRRLTLLDVCETVSNYPPIPISALTPGFSLPTMVSRVTTKGATRRKRDLGNDRG
jgi:hypothetical protein